MKHLGRAARSLLEELESGGLVVAKFRTEDGWVRKPVSVNVRWYQEFCAENPSNRKRQRWKNPRTIIKRCDTITALHRIARGNLNGLYAQRLLPYLRKRANEIRRGERRKVLRRSSRREMFDHVPF